MKGQISNFIEFERYDIIDTSFDRIVEPIVTSVVNNTHLLPYLCECILHFNNYEKYSRKEGDITSFEKWQERLKSIFKTEFVDDFILKLRRLYEEGKDDHKKLSRLRGRVLELLIFHFVYKRYNAPGYIVLQGCGVKINGRLIATEERKTVDIAAWNGMFGEFYETKVGPDLFDEKVIKYLGLLAVELQKVNLKSIVACVTMASVERLERQMEKFNWIEGSKFLKCVGRENLLNICNSSL
ncbi:hypothetical protein [Caldicellulosiruptor sp. DIB 104C]|uniref:hypothetical protein n=1 Tax=Caldicellulosiruptor sp. DIB 104C TaxID=3019889 RepID=UPI00230588C3|nr:hypothetical protein [Caldicellulosiruptor sp. DIB 104C]